MTTLAIFLSVLKYILIILGSGLGIYGASHDYKSEGKLTHAGQVAVRAMIAIAALIVVTAALEQYVAHRDSALRAEKERLSVPLSDLLIEWQLSPAQSQIFADVVERSNSGRPVAEWNEQLLYISAAERGGELAVSRGFTGWNLTLSLQRGPWLLNRYTQDSWSGKRLKPPSSES